MVTGGYGTSGALHGGVATCTLLGLRADRPPSGVHGSLRSQAHRQSSRDAEYASNPPISCLNNRHHISLIELGCDIVQESAMNMIDLGLGQAAERHLQMIDELRLATLTTTYPFEDNNEFERILRDNQKRGMQIYWEEILYRAHLCSVISILRTRHWISSILSATRDNNLLSFAAALRGFIESVADASSSLRVVPLTLAHLHPKILEVLSGEADQLLLSSELEGELIHFAYAHHMSGSEAKNAPPHHRARRVRDYIEILEQGEVKNVVKCYSEMCDLTHPGQSSVWMWLGYDRGTIRLSSHQDESIIVRYIQNYRQTFRDLIMFGFNPPIITLKVLNYFPIQRLHFPQINDWNLSSILGWRKCEYELRNSRIVSPK